MSAAKGNFLQEHWDWLVAGAGALALVAAVVLCAGGLGASADEAVAERAAALNARRPRGEAVKETDLAPFESVTRQALKPPTVRDDNLGDASFLASAARFACRPGLFELKPEKDADGLPLKKADGSPKMTLVASENGKPFAAGEKGPVPLVKPCGGLPIAWVDATNVCPFCHAYQHRDPEAVEKNEDVDGLDKAWKRKHGLPVGKDVAKADADGDGFTNAEEFEAKTDPAQAGSHPDYLDYASLQGEIRHTSLPFYVSVANKVPDGKGGWTHRLTLPRLGAKKNEDRQFFVKVGEKVMVKSGKRTIDTGFTLVSFTAKSEQRKIAGSNARRNVDISEAVFARNEDGKKVTARIGVKSVPVDCEATIVFARGGGKPMKVRVGDTVKVLKNTYEVKALEGTGAQSKVTLKDVADGHTKTFGAASSSGLD